MCVGIYIKRKLFLERVDSLSQRGILTLNIFHIDKAIRGAEITCDGKLETQYQNTKTHQPNVESSKTHKPRAKLQEINFFFF
jgi:hypothetical protein